MNALLSSPFGRTARLRRILNRGERALDRGQLSSAEQAGRTVVAVLDNAACVMRMAEHGELLVAGLELVAKVRREVTDLTATASLHERALSVLDTGGNVDGDDLLSVVVLGRWERRFGCWAGTTKPRITSAALSNLLT